MTFNSTTDRSVSDALAAFERDGGTVAWSDCSRCDRPRAEHTGPGLRCPAAHEGDER